MFNVGLNINGSLIYFLEYQYAQRKFFCDCMNRKKDITPILNLIRCSTYMYYSLCDVFGSKGDSKYAQRRIRGIAMLLLERYNNRMCSRHGTDAFVLHKSDIAGGSNGKQGGRIYVPYSNSGRLLWRKTDYPQIQEHADGILQLFHLEEGRGQSFFQNGGFVQGDRLRNGRNTGLE